MNRISTPLARRDTGAFQFAVYKDFAYTSKIAELGEGIITPATDLSAGNIDIASVLPDKLDVQLVTPYTVVFTTEHTMYPPAGIKIEFPPSIILPPTGSEVTITPQGATRDIIVPRKGTIESGNIVEVSNVFGGVKPRDGPLEIELRIEGIQNPYSSRPAGNAFVRTYYEEDMVDEGESDGTFTPISGTIDGTLSVSPAVTSGISSIYELRFTP